MTAGTNVLVTSASRKVGLVRAFQEALAKEGGGRVIAVDASPLSPALYAADEYEVVPRGDSAAAVQGLLSICERRKVRLLVPTRDEELPLLAAHRERFESIGVLPLVSPPQAVRLCQDKRAFVAFCEARGFAVPRTWTEGARPEPGEYPVFFKPRHGKGGQGAGPVASPDHLALLLAQDPGGMVQEFVRDQEYTIDLCADLQGRAISAVPRQRLRIVAGESYVSRTVRHPALIAEAVRLAQELGLVGHVTIQCFFEGARAPRFIEVNPRFGGAANLGFAAGAPTPQYIVRMAKGEPVAPRLGEFQDGLVMLRYATDTFMAAASLPGSAS
ncbi:MAG TPA: ATP-grasp domain-containing protein [Polyangiaceae bacterium]|nr:ATP-grasp domain-containing protein [Polyangiaceae bacterium]